MDPYIYEYRPPLDLSNPRLRTLAAALGPAYVRVSGIWANTTYFADTDPAPAGPPEGFDGVLTRDQWHGVVDFLARGGCQDHVFVRHQPGNAESGRGVDVRPGPPVAATPRKPVRIKVFGQLPLSGSTRPAGAQGVRVAAHHTLVASDYGLLDDTDFTPKPNYWAALLWHRLMGPTVLDSGEPVAEGTLLYAHCQPGTPGGVTLLVINNDRPAARTFQLSEAAERYTLAANPLESRTVSLNGKPLALGPDDALPALSGAPVDVGEVTLEPATITFLTIPTAGNSVMAPAGPPPWRYSSIARAAFGATRLGCSGPPQRRTGLPHTRRTVGLRATRRWRNPVRLRTRDARRNRTPRPEAAPITRAINMVTIHTGPTVKIAEKQTDEQAEPGTAGSAGDAARPLVMRPVMRSTVRTPSPMMLTCSTGKPPSDIRSTSRCASTYLSNDAMTWRAGRGSPTCCPGCPLGFVTLYPIC